MHYHARFKILFFFVLLVGSFCSVAASLKEQLQNILDTSIAHSRTPGAVLLVSNPNIGINIVASGFADKARKIPMTVSNNFRIASMSKTFLAVTLLRLIEEGDFNLDDKVADLLPDTIDVNRIPNGNKVTIRELLQMRSGIPNYVNFDSYSELIQSMTGKKWTPQVCIKLIYDMKPLFAPGKKYEYSNTNFLLLQLVVENKTGGSYAHSIRSKLLAPLNMNHTFIETQESDDTHYLATRGYSVEEGQLVDVTDYNDGWGLADGGIISTATDMNILVRALLKDKTLLSAKSLHEMLSFIDDYGLGIWREDINDESAISHNGLTSGFQGQYYYFPERKLTVILLTNNFDTDIIPDVISKTHRLVNGL